MPILLAGIIMIAGIFAFMPVEQASTVHTTIATDIDNQNRAFTFAVNMSEAAGQLQLIKGESGQTITGTFVLSSTPSSINDAGGASGTLECGLTDGGTGKVSATNSSETAPSAGDLAALASGEGISMQVPGAGGNGVCQATIIIDTFADG